MPWTQNDVDWVAARLLPDLHAIYQRSAYVHTTRRLEKLHRELSRFMKIRIIEPTFFLGQERKVGDILDHVETGPFRNQVIPGGLTLIPQFVEMPDEIKQIIQGAVAEISPTQVPAAPSPVITEVAAAAPARGSFGEATAVILKPAAPAATPVSRTAATLSALAGRRRKLEEQIGVEATDYAKLLDEVETAVPQTFTKAKESLADRKASLGEISDSLKDLAGSNGGDPL